MPRLSGVAGARVVLLAILAAVGVGALFARPAAAAAPPTYPPGTRTGVPRIDHVLAAFDGHDAKALAGMVRYLDLPCTFSPDPDKRDHRPRCKPGELEGKKITVFWEAACQGELVRRVDVRADFADFLSEPPLLYAVYRVPASGAHSPFAPRGGAGIEVVRNYGPGQEPLGAAILVGPRGGITALLLGCGDGPKHFLDAHAGSLILAPR